MLSRIFPVVPELHGQGPKVEASNSWVQSSGSAERWWFREWAWPPSSTLPFTPPPQMWDNWERKRWSAWGQCMFKSPVGSAAASSFQSQGKMALRETLEVWRYLQEGRIGLSLPLWVSAWPADVMTYWRRGRTGKDSGEPCGLWGYHWGTPSLHCLLERCPKEPPLPDEGSSESWRLWGGRPFVGAGWWLGLGEETNPGLLHPGNGCWSQERERYGITTVR